MTRAPNTQGTGWAWQITFHDDVGELALLRMGRGERGGVVGASTVTPTLLRCDSSKIYSTNGDSAMTAVIVRDQGVGDVPVDASTELGKERSRRMVRIEPE